MKKTVVLDFDGVIHSYTSGWQGVTVIPDPPVDGIRDAINEIRFFGYEVAVVSTRTATPEGAKAVQDWLRAYDIEVDKVCSEKPPAHVYVDDRAICFDGDAQLLFHRIYDFKTWMEIRDQKPTDIDAQKTKLGLTHCTCHNIAVCTGCPYDTDDIGCNSDQMAEDALNLINSLEHQVGELTKMVPKWIDVKEQLPEHFKRVLVVREGADGPIVEQGFKDVGDWWKVYGTRTKKVFFWMPMPEPPEGAAYENA